MGPDDLRRALVEPARKRGYRFEDEALVNEMVSTVEGARGALPLLAFAVARLWEKRGRERRVLTHEAYREIAGVEGALAQHAEAVMDRIGPEHQATVREIFRNLVTAQGTRAVIEREELLSAFPDRPAAEEVLRQLIDARLLTSYEVEGKEGQPSHHRVEVVHESLLKAWPRLVRWQAQDEEGTLLRDQLKQAAHLWEEKGRKADLLWTGTAYAEYELWRSRYPGVLTALEEDFARSMADKARRKRRLVRVAVAAVVLVSTGVAILIAISRHKAVVAALQAEASKLLAVAQLKLQEDPTEALAYATASLELTDTRDARLMALRALYEAPPAWELATEIAMVRTPAFSPDGRRLAVAGHSSVVGVWDESGGPPAQLPGHETSAQGGIQPAWASAELLVTGPFGLAGQRVHVWSLPGGTKRRTIDFGVPSFWEVGPERLFAQTPVKPATGTCELRWWQLPAGEPEALGRIDRTSLGATTGVFEPHGRAFLFTRGTTTHLVPLPFTGEAARVFSRHGADVTLLKNRGRPDLVLQHDAAGENRIVLFREVGPPLTTILPKPDSAPTTAPATSSDRWICGFPSDDARLRLWDRHAPPGARPLEMRREGSWYGAKTDVDPGGRVAVATTHSMSRLTFWPLPARWPSIADGYKQIMRPLAFSPDSRWLATSWADGRLRLWPLPGTGSTEVRVLGTPSLGLWSSLQFDPKGRYLFAAGIADNAWIVPLDGSLARKLEAHSKDPLLILLSGAAVSPTGRRVASAFTYGKGSKTLRVWDVETGAVRLFDLPEPSWPPGSPPRAPTGYEAGVVSLAFLDDSTLYTAGHGGIRRWNLEAGEHELVKDYGPAVLARMSMSETPRTAFVRKGSLGGSAVGCVPWERVDLATGQSAALLQLGDCPSGWEARGAGSVFVTAGRDGIVRVARDSDAEAWVLPGHTGPGQCAAVSPDLRWIASTGEDNTLRLWPMPDLSRPPLHTLPHDELLAKLQLAHQPPRRPRPEVLHRLDDRARPLPRLEGCADMVRGKKRRRPPVGTGFSYARTCEQPGVHDREPGERPSRAPTRPRPCPLAPKRTRARSLPGSPRPLRSAPQRPRRPRRAVPPPECPPSARLARTAPGSWLVPGREGHQAWSRLLSQHDPDRPDPGGSPTRPLQHSKNLILGAPHGVTNRTRLQGQDLLTKVAAQPPPLLAVIPEESQIASLAAAVRVFLRQEVVPQLGGRDDGAIGGQLHVGPGASSMRPKDRARRGHEGSGRCP